MPTPPIWEQGRLCCALTWILVTTAILSPLPSPSHAQEFDFTPSTSGSQPSPDPALVPPPVPDTTQVVPPSDPTDPLEDTVPTMPILPQVQTGDLPTVALPDAPIPVSAPAAAPSSASYTRQPNITPGVPVGGSQPGKLLEGDTLPLTVYRPFTFQPYQAINGNLEVSDPVSDGQGNVVIPAGSVVWGSFVPVIEQTEVDTPNGDTRLEERLVGNRFVANRLTVGSKTYLLQGTSELLPTGLDPEADLGTVALRGAGYGALGGLALSVFTGGLAAPLLAGSAVGVAAGSTTVDRVVTLAPNTVVSVTLSEDLILR